MAVRVGRSTRCGIAMSLKHCHHCRLIQAAATVKEGLNRIRPFQGKAPDETDRPDNNERLEQHNFVGEMHLAFVQVNGTVPCVVLDGQEGQGSHPTTKGEHGQNVQNRPQQMVLVTNLVQDGFDFIFGATRSSKLVHDHLDGWTGIHALIPRAPAQDQNGQDRHPNVDKDVGGVAEGDELGRNLGFFLIGETFFNSLVIRSVLFIAGRVQIHDFGARHRGRLALTGRLDFFVTGCGTGSVGTHLQRGILTRRGTGFNGGSTNHGTGRRRWTRKAKIGKVTKICLHDDADEGR
eukprot:scaffold6506_cov171-Amphora_coffeaeformis.AAC.2